MDEQIWDRLAAHGAALSTREQLDLVPTEASLAVCLSDAITNLAAHPEQPDHHRKTTALAALLFTLNHFHSDVFQRLPQEIQNHLPHEITGKLIKLKRISAQHLARYL